MKAILIKAKADDRISSVAIPGLCTGVGRNATHDCCKPDVSGL
jgi:hypothetical protein